VAIPFGIAARLLVATLPGEFSLRTFIQPPAWDLFYLLYAIYFFNLAMFAFNLLPIPGLDGWRVLEAIFRTRNARFFFEANMRRREVWGIAFVVVLLASFVGLNVLGWVMSPFFHPASALIFGTCVAYPGLSPCLPLGG
jgi:Zn-dependent protease